MSPAPRHRRGGPRIRHLNKPLFVLSNPSPQSSFSNLFPHRDIAQTYPTTQIIGTDISPIQPSFVPTNVSFQLDDAQLPWTFPSHHFDFVHLRGLVGAIRDWPFLYAQVYRCLKPGGWFEHRDFSVEPQSETGSLPEQSPLRSWQDVLAAASRKSGKTFRVVDDSANVAWFKAAGFTKIKEERSIIPIGSWHEDPELKIMGGILEAATEQSVEGCGMYILTKLLDWSAAEARAFLIQVKAALRDSSSARLYLEM